MRDRSCIFEWFRPFTLYLSLMVISCVKVMMQDAMIIIFKKIVTPFASKHCSFDQIICCSYKIIFITFSFNFFLYSYFNLCTLKPALVPHANTQGLTLLRIHIKTTLLTESLYAPMLLCDSGKKTH